jgi:hypothetical protein
MSRLVAIFAAALRLRGARFRGPCWSDRAGARGVDGLAYLAPPLTGTGVEETWSFGAVLHFKCAATLRLTF